MFIRFVMGLEREHHRDLTGVITEARLLRDDGRLDHAELEWLAEAYAWLNENLPVPPFYRGWPSSAASWFKDGARDSIRRVWGIVSILRVNGLPVRVLRSRSPGKILYEDEHQVVADEWRRI